MSEEGTPKFRQSRQKHLQLVHNGYVYCRDTHRGDKVYWRCRLFRNGICGARLMTMNEKIISQQKDHTHEPEEKDEKVENEEYEEISAQMSS